MSEKTERIVPQFNFSDETRIRLPLVMLLSLLAVVAASAVVWSGDHSAVAEHKLKLEDHAARLRALEESQTDFAVMKNDVKWIRSTLEQQARRQP